MMGVDICPLHSIPLKDGRCPLCEGEEGKPTPKQQQKASSPAPTVLTPPPSPPPSTVLTDVCPVHKIPLKDGVCEECARGEAAPAVAEKALPEVCPSCGAQVIGQGSFCVKCGAKLTPDEKQKNSQAETQVEIKIPPSHVPTFGSAIKVVFESVEGKQTKTVILEKPAENGVSAIWEQAKWISFPATRTLWVWNFSGREIYVFPKDRAVPILEGDILRVGRIPFVLHLAGNPQGPSQGTRSATELRTVFQWDLPEGSDNEVYLLDCLECLHPNFRGRTLNLEEEVYVLARKDMMAFLGIRDESILARAGVSSTPIRLYRNQNGIWWVASTEKPVFSLRAPLYMFPIFPGELVEIHGKLWILKEVAS